MDVKERYAEAKKERREAFHGSTYYYNTPGDGRKTIGVMLGLGSDIYMVGYFRDNGARKRVKSARLPAITNPAQLQKYLDVWAAERGLEEVPA